MTRSYALFLLASCLVACQTAAPGSASSLLRPQVQTFNDTSFAMNSCEITPERTAICRLTVTNRFRDKRLEVDRRITIQDDTGTDHPVTAGGFGVAAARPQWNQVAIADGTYELTVVATNLSSQASAIRAVVFTRLLVRSTQGQALGYRDNVIFSRPTMIASGPRSPDRATSAGRPAAASSPGWRVVGYWNYDAADGQHLASQGLVLRPTSGAGLGEQWTAQLELKNHAALSPRTRSLWPVKIHPGQRKVCADYPGYPTYSAFIDMPGTSDDGVYLVAPCSGD